MQLSTSIQKRYATKPVPVCLQGQVGEVLDMPYDEPQKIVVYKRQIRKPPMTYRPGRCFLRQQQVQRHQRKRCALLRLGQPSDLSEQWQRDFNGGS